jgi:hypothetical protein
LLSTLKLFTDFYYIPYHGFLRAKAKKERAFSRRWGAEAGRASKEGKANCFRKDEDIV